MEKKLKNGEKRDMKKICIGGIMATYFLEIFILVKVCLRKHKGYWKLV